MGIEIPGGNPMKHNTTNSHSQLVKSQLSTDATLVEVYSAGNTRCYFYSGPTLHYEILISNKHRAIREKKLKIKNLFFLNRKIDKQAVDEANIKTLYSDK